MEGLAASAVLVAGRKIMTVRQGRGARSRSRESLPAAVTSPSPIFTPAMAPCGSFSRTCRCVSAPASRSRCSAPTVTQVDPDEVGHGDGAAVVGQHQAENRGPTKLVGRSTGDRRSWHRFRAERQWAVPKIDRDRIPAGCGPTDRPLGDGRNLVSASRRFRAPKGDGQLAPAA